MTVEFTVPGDPVSKARPRVTRGGKHTYTPSTSKAYETLVALKAKEAMQGRKPIEGAIVLDVEFILKRPKSHYRTNGDIKPKYLDAGYAHTKRPDLDNFLKSVLDGCNEIVFKDDSQVYSITVGKWYVDDEESPHTAVNVSPSSV